MPRPIVVRFQPNGWFDGAELHKGTKQFAANFDTTRLPSTAVILDADKTVKEAQEKRNKEWMKKTGRILKLADPSAIPDGAKEDPRDDAKTLKEIGDRGGVVEL